ncbi:MAG: serine/threonine protein kinase [Cystobacterineae bacterium]|nr:serine/threonine protein kinase [Cystobacterineae bacterium]
MHIGNYRLIQKISTDELAELWLAEAEAETEGFSSQVLLQRILPSFMQNEDSQSASIFVEEQVLWPARLASQLSHPNIAQIYEAGECEGEYFVAMEYIHGAHLGRVMQRSLELERWVSSEVALSIAAELCSALHYMHTLEDTEGHPLEFRLNPMGVQHIWLGFDGSIKLAGVGIAQAPRYSNPDSAKGIAASNEQLSRMSPEHIQGLWAPHSDIFSLGVVLYELLTAVHPFKRDTEFATLEAILKEEALKPSEVAEISPKLDALLMQALAKNPEERYADAQAFQAAIEQCLLAQGGRGDPVHIAELMEELFPDAQEAHASIQRKDDTTEELPAVPARLKQNRKPREAPKQTPKHAAKRAQKKARALAEQEETVLELTPVNNKAAAEPSSGRRSWAKWGVGGLVVAVLLLVLSLAFWGPREPLPPGIAIGLSISTTPPTQVFALREEGKKRVFVGATPFKNRRGVVAGEKLLLVNELSQIRYEVQLPMLAEGEVFALQKNFEKGQLRIVTHPQNVAGVEIFLKGSPKLFAVVDYPIPFYEGVYELELRGKALKEPVPFRAEVKPGEETSLITVDVEHLLAPSP